MSRLRLLKLIDNAIAITEDTRLKQEQLADRGATRRPSKH
jgi:hypothetical protein